MRYLLVSIFLGGYLQAQVVLARSVEIDVYGMTCAFCVDSLERTFGKVEAITGIDISLEKKKVRLETVGDQPSIETIKQMILEAGFTPVKVNVLPVEE
jgi:copper chaperone CopZ